MNATLFTPIYHFLLAERLRLALWLPVAMGIGIGAYFALNAEPPFWVSLPFMLVAFVGIYLTRHSLWRWLFVYLAFAASAFLLAQYETARMQAPKLPYAITPRELTGTVQELSVTPEGVKLLLSDVSIAHISPQRTPPRVRISLKFTPDVKPGDRVRLRAGLFPPSAPAYPGGFDFARHFYFKRIGAIGFGIAPVTLEERVDELRWWEKWNEEYKFHLETTRTRLSNHIRSQMPGTNGAVAEGFITGETSSIPPETYEIMRDAGLAHLVAVSGMNLALVSGISFYLVRLLLALIPGMALHYNIKKGAALIALLMSLAYLLLAGAPVSATRAFLMVSLLFIAILVNRTPDPMRSIMLAAIIILAITPDALLGAGFQLSFAATLGLVAFYETFRERLQQQYGFRRIGFYALGLFFTSLVAGLATAPYTLYHFHQIASYTLLANIIAAPLVSFIIMPAGVIAMLLMAFGLDGIAYVPMGWGIEWMLKAATWVVSLPQSMLHFPALPLWGLIVISIGGLWLVFWRSRIRLAGLLLIVIGFASLATSREPSLLVTADMRQVAALQNSKWALIKGKKPNFDSEQWMEYLGLDSFAEAVKYCDSMGCIAPFGDYKIILPRYPQTLQADCAADAIIIADFKVSNSCRAALIIDKPLLRKYGAHAVHVTKHGPKAVSAASGQGLRPWAEFVPRRFD